MSWFDWLAVAGSIASLISVLAFWPKIYAFMKRELGRSVPGKVPVRFTQGMPPYNANEVAGFDRERAERYVKAGCATYFRGRDRVVAWLRDLRRLGT